MSTEPVQGPKRPLTQEEWTTMLADAAIAASGPLYFERDLTMVEKIQRAFVLGAVWQMERLQP